MLDYIIIGLLVVIIVLVIIAISKNVNEGKITERLGNLETNTVKELSSFQIDIMKTMNDNFNGLSDRMEKYQKKSMNWRCPSITASARRIKRVSPDY